MSNIQHPMSNRSSEQPGAGPSFPRCGKKFSIAWKNRGKVFHCVGKNGQFFHSVEKSFPWRGKIAKKFSTVWKTFLLAAGLATAAAAEEPSPWVAESDWGPLASWMTDADGNARFRAAGPFWEQAESPDGKKLQAFPRPFYARAVDPAADRDSWDCLWPISAGKTFGKQQSWRVINSYFFDRDRTDPESQYHYWFLPFWFHGRDEGGTGYAGLWPLGGEIRNLLWKDRIRFILWPIWTQSRVNDVRTTDVLWPLISRTTTPDHHLEQFRVFPFYAHAKNARQYEKRTILWPIWTQTRYVHPKAAGTAWVLFPLCGRVNLNSQKGWMFLPPFFQHIRGEKLTRTLCPWPFFQRETGFREKLIVWPLYGYHKDGALERRYWLWPLLIREKNEWGFKQVTRWSVVPFYTSVSQSDNPAPAGWQAGKGILGLAAGPAEAAPAAAPAGPPRVTANRTKLWPAYSRIYDLEQASYRLRLLDLWPAGHPPPVERSWAPLWTVLDYRVRGADSDLDVFWGLYRATRREAGARAFSLFPLWRHERTGGDAARRWSVLKGLIAYDRTATNRQVRFLWLGRISLNPAARMDAPNEDTP